ncbi:IclR family transcriptional regulator [Microbacterium fluvii]|uniref:IclR family transcriptional regulator n=1 Tax=Microbacterium fluvii TaxID=415215 RepID=A0ABW2HGL3_9MICO|nr:IclR family transcriptional regulator [Microbacterium fluvii]MCU4673882.1 IclR family transcriptional regulator [Microbacterium fluvii]
MGAESSREGAGIRSADRVLRILDAVGRAADGLTAAELARLLDLSPATTYRLIGTLQAHDFIVRAEGARFVLGRAADGLGRAVRSQIVATPAVRGVLEVMRDDARAPAYLTVFRGDDIAIAHVADSAAHPRIGQLHVGFAEAAHVTAFGKLMLAARDDDGVRRYLERHGAPAVAFGSVTSERALLDQLDEVRALQIAVEVEEYMPKLACIAAPVRSASGRTIGAVSLSTTADDFRSRAHDLEKIVRRGAWHVSSRLPRDRAVRTT